MRSGSYGSIGTVSVIPDYSEALKAQGVKVHRIASGIYKGAFMPGAEVTPEHLEMEQARIIENANTFKAAVRLTRSSVEDDTMEGQWFYGRESAKRGLITGLADGIEDVLARLNA
jgi:ClpP class serine protease